MSDAPAGGITLAAPEETAEVGRILGEVAEPGDVLVLSGELGAGKTTLVRGLAVGLGIPAEQVSSPTFTLIHEHRGGRIPLYHMDVYRLESEEEFHLLGAEEYLDADGVTAVEWGERVRGALPPDRLEVHLALAGAGRRMLWCAATGPRSLALAAAWRRRWES